MGGTVSSSKSVARPVVHPVKSIDLGPGTPCQSVTFDPKPLTQPFIPVLTKALVERSRALKNDNKVHLDAFVDLVFPDTRDLGKRMFQYLLRYYHDQVQSKKEKCCAIPEKDFVSVLDAKFQDACGQDNMQVFLTLFAAEHGLPVMTRDDFREFLLICYEAASEQKRSGAEEEESVIFALVTSAFHQKEEVNIGYLQGWIKRNCPLLTQPLAKYVIHRLSTAHESVGDSEQKHLPYTQELPIVCKSGMPEEASDQRGKLLPPVLVWILSTALPETYSKPSKGTPSKKSRFPTLSEILANLSVPRKWSLLYDTDDHGMAMNRFIHHVMKYRGPTIMIISAEHGYRFCLGVDEEWRDTGSYWGGSDSCILELEPELHDLATGAKIVCFNSSIRGYPIGLSVGPDPRAPLIRIGESWNKLEFKKIPLSLVRIAVFGAGEAQLVETQEKLRKARDEYAVSRRVVDRRKMLEEYEVDRQILSMGSAPSNFNADRFRRPAPE